MRQKITPCLWFDDNAEEAINFYVSIFKNSEILHVRRYTEAGPGVPGSMVAISFRLDGQEFEAINGGPYFKFTEAISFAIDCESQEEVDELWEKLTEGGEPSQCGWLKDKYVRCPENWSSRKESRRSIRYQPPTSTGVDSFPDRPSSANSCGVQ